jgi:hypothetical protein
MAEDHRTHSLRSMRRMPDCMVLCEGSFIVNRPSSMYGY